MKLYSTITSERATKGQGGNEYIEAVFYVGSKTESIPVMSIKMDITEDGKHFNMWGIDYKKDKIIFFENREIKGKRQKGEMWVCGVCGTEFPNAPTNPTCPKCKTLVD